MNARRLYGKRNGQRGQSLTEYVILLVVIVGLGKLVTGQLPKYLKRIEGPFKDGFARTYKYGIPSGCGFDGDPPACSGTPERHPRFKDTNRMFARGRN
ncbi:MAG: hypothetical protein HY074_10035 [Deltaproteobacteria bacterium]|nr:hypothetical protein [Deltaproteobacteria bacterium]